MSDPGGHLRETIEGQPAEVARILRDVQPVRVAAERLAGAGRIFVCGTGTSYHGSMVGEHLLRGAGVDARAIPAYEFSQYPPRLSDRDAVIVLSHRASKRFSAQALRLFEHGSRWVAIVGEGTPLSGPGVIVTVPQEQSSVHTASHLGAMLRLAQLAHALGGPPVPADLVKSLEIVVGARQEPAAIAGALDEGRATFFAGGGPAWATALEGALKLREAAYVFAEGHELESILHGPLVSIDVRDMVVLIVEPGPSLARAQEVAAGITAIGTRLFAVGSAAGQIADATWSLPTPVLPETFAPLVNVVPLQWLAYEASRRRGADADVFRRNDPRYAAAQARYQL